MKKDIIFLIFFCLGLYLLVSNFGCASGHKTGATKPVIGVGAAQAMKPDQATASVNGEAVNQTEVECPESGDCHIELTVPINEAVVISLNRTDAGNNKVPTWVKYFALPAAGAAAGAGYFGMKYPNEFNEEDGTVFYSSTSKGALVGAASGVALGLILDLLDD